jgi:hypothetical protein
MLHSDKSKCSKHISKSVYVFGNINDAMNTFKVTRKQQILEIHVKTLHMKVLRNNEGTQRKHNTFNILINQKTK